MSDTPAKPEFNSEVDAPRQFFINKREAGYDALGMIVQKGTGSLIQSGAREIEDEFKGINDLGQEHALIHPTFNLATLSRLAWSNSIIPPLIEAMEVNIDGTGAEISLRNPPKEGDKSQKDDRPSEKKDSKQEFLQSFFTEPWPGESFLTIRRKLRHDLEEVGNGYLEVLRNVADEVKAVRWIDAKTIRLLKYDAPVEVEKILFRGDKEEKLNILLRERRYVQTIGGRFVFFKDFTASRDLNKKTGQWVGFDTQGRRVDENQELGTDNTPGERLPPDERSTELIHFVNKKDPESPYGLPRWVGAMPSAVGSRKAEEFNLEFFDAGGIPPILIIVQGGRLAEDAEQALRAHFMATGTSRHQAAILEAFSTTGDINSNQNVRVTVERFGSDRQKDSMFETYVANCDTRVQRTFRLPSLFLGMTADFSFATAFASYTVAEAQVFQPERNEFDEAVNLKLMPLLPSGRDYIYRSLPVIAVGAETQLKGMELVRELVDPAELVEEVNQLANLSLNLMPVSDEERIRAIARDEFTQIRDPRSLRDVNPATSTGPERTADDVKHPRAGQSRTRGPKAVGTKGRTQDSGAEPNRTRPAVKKGEEQPDTLSGLQVLAEDLADQMAQGFRDDAQVALFRDRLAEFDSLHPAQEEVVKSILAHLVYPMTADDPEGAVGLLEGLLRQFARE